MFDFIKQQIAAQQKSNEDTRTQIAENNENDLIVECAQLFQELDAMSVGGQEINEYRDIDTLSVALEDDVELESFEVSMADGRILDLPADILVHSESYEPMKSVEDFREFALNEIHKGAMSNDEYNNYLKEYPALENEEVYVINKLNKDEKNNLEEMLKKPLVQVYLMQNDQMQEKIKEGLFANVPEPQKEAMKDM